MRALLSGETLPQLLFERAKTSGKVPALREKKLGIWRTLTWSQYADEVKRTAIGLMSLGLGKGDKVALIGDNHQELLFMELAVQALGGWSVALYPDFLPDQIAELLNRSEVKVVLAYDQEQVDKILQIKERVPDLKKVVYADGRGMRNYRDSILMSFAQLQEMGGKMIDKDSQRELEDAIAGGTANDIAMLCLTSGTTGVVPKLAMLSHGNLIFSASKWLEVNPLTEKENYVSILPFAWIGEQIQIAISLIGGIIYNFPEDPETAMSDLREIAPTRIAAPPRMWERIASDIMFKASDSTWLKKKVYEIGISVGREIAEKQIKKQEIPFSLQIARQIFYWLVFRPILDKYGLKRIRYAVTGGGALGSDYFLFFRALGVNLREIYALTESSALGTTHQGDDIKVGTCGKPVPGVEVKISDAGEILIRGKNIFQGYYKDYESTRKTIVEGWLHTGDTGLLDEDGHLVVIDRIGDVMTLADGTKFSPQYIENKLKFSPFIREAVIYGEGMPYLVGILNIDYENVSKWAERQQISFSDYADLSQKPEVYHLLENEVIQVNKTLPERMRIRRFTILHKELDADDLELTRTRKLRRKFVYQRYSEILRALYTDTDSVDAKVQVTYRDGTTAVLQSRLKIRRLEVK
ncbi:MAG: AMP-binding protein [Nitrososphaerota archaeon]|nr:AMP-binding protein [Nitrososphaerota archaeon]